MKSKQFSITFVCALLLVAVAGCQKQAAAPTSTQSIDKSFQNSITNPSSPVYGWEKYSSVGGKFSAIFPERPGEEQKTTQGQDGEVQAHTFASETGAHAVYSVTYFDLPQDKDPKLLLTSIEQAIVAHQNGKLVSYRLFQVENNPATEFEFVGGCQTNFSGDVRLISIGQRIYAFDALFLAGHPPNPGERDAFFNSFSLLQN
jgi:hypothetical protein